MKLTITVPKPCHEDWGAMHARSSGRFCDSCQHTVTDLTRASDAELVALFTSDARPKCARFDPTQLDRVLASERERNPVSALQATVFTSALALGAAPALAQTTLGEPALKGKVTAVDHTVRGEAKCAVPTQGPATSHALIGDTIAIALPEEESVPIAWDLGSAAPEEILMGKPMAQPPELGILVEGVVHDSGTGEPLPFANVTIEGRTAGTTTDFDGRFALRLPEDLPLTDAVLLVNYVGFESASVALCEKGGHGIPPNMDGAAPRGAGSVSGMVRDQEGHPLANTIVTMVGTDVFQYTDAAGYFAFDPPADFDRKMVELMIGADHGMKRIEVPVERIPLCVQVQLDSAPPIVDPACATAHVDVGLIPMRQEIRVVMGEMIYVPVKRSFGSRVAGPFRSAGRWLGDLVR